MKTKINSHDPGNRIVSVTFDHEGVTHTRNVNACYGEDGQLDQEATDARIAEVAAGVAAKIALGAIVNPPPPEVSTSSRPRSTR